MNELAGPEITELGNKEQTIEEAQREISELIEKFRNIDSIFASDIYQLFLEIRDKIIQSSCSAEQMIEFKKEIDAIAPGLIEEIFKKTDLIKARFDEANQLLSEGQKEEGLKLISEIIPVNFLDLYSGAEPGDLSEQDRIKFFQEYVQYVINENYYYSAELAQGTIGIRKTVPYYQERDLVPKKILNQILENDGLVSSDLLLEHFYRLGQESITRIGSIIGQKCEGANYWQKAKSMELAHTELLREMDPMKEFCSEWLMELLRRKEERDLTDFEQSNFDDFSSRRIELASRRLAAEKKLLSWLSDFNGFEETTLYDLDKLRFEDLGASDIDSQPEEYYAWMKESGVPIFFPGIFVTPEEGGLVLGDRRSIAGIHIGTGNLKHKIPVEGNPLSFLGIQIGIPQGLEGTARHEDLHQIDFLDGARVGINKIITELLAYRGDVAMSRGEWDWKRVLKDFSVNYIPKYNDESLTLKDQEQLVADTVKVIERLDDLVGERPTTHILLNSKTLEDIFQWGRLSDDELLDYFSNLGSEDVQE